MENQRAKTESGRKSAYVKTTERRQQIVATALELIRDEGIEQLSIAAIAQQLGLVPSAIYRHFSGKDEILLAANRMISEQLLANVRQVCAATDQPLERLQLLLQRHFELLRNNDGIPRYVFATGSLNDHPERKKSLFQGIQLYLSRIEAIIAEGQQSGQLRTDVAAEVLALMFFGLIQPAIFLAQLSDGAFASEAQLQIAWQLFAASIQVEEEGKLLNL